MKYQDVRFCLRCGSTLENRELFGAHRPVCPACGWTYFEDPKVAVGVLVEQDSKVLLVKRVNEPMPGCWSIPAGFMDAHEDPCQAAERECLEETGLVACAGAVTAVIGRREHPKGADIVIAFQARIVGGATACRGRCGRGRFLFAGFTPTTCIQSNPHRARA